MNYENLKNSIRAVIKENGNEDITGNILQVILISMVSEMGGNRTFAGIATPTTNPPTTDGNVFYIATQNGTYTNFGSIVLNDEVAFIYNLPNGWQKVTTSLASTTMTTILETRIAEVKNTADLAMIGADNANEILDTINRNHAEYTCNTEASEPHKEVESQLGYRFGEKAFVRFPNGNTATSNVTLTLFGLGGRLIVDGYVVNEDNQIQAGEILEVWLTYERRNIWMARRLVHPVINTGTNNQVLTSENGYPKYQYPMENAGFTRTLDNLVRMLNGLHTETQIDKFWDNMNKCWDFEY